MATAQRRVDLVSAYFIPGKIGTEWFTDIASEDKQVRILTNALVTTDVLMVHSGYVKYRKELLGAGVELFEMKTMEGAPKGREELNAFGLSGASLHAKSFSIDDDIVWIEFDSQGNRKALNEEPCSTLVDRMAIAVLGWLPIEWLL